MTKQVDILSGDTKSIEKKSTTNTSTKKEGASFFDSMLSSAKAKSSETPVEQKALKKSIKNTESKVSEKATNNQDAISSKKEKSEDTVEVKKTNNKQSSNPEVKQEVTAVSSQKEVSLLDRMLMEANNVLKDPKKEIKVAVKSDAAENKMNKKGDAEIVKSEKGLSELKQSIINVKDTEKEDTKKIDIKSEQKESVIVEKETANTKELISINKTEKNSTKNNQKEETKIPSDSKDIKPQPLEIKESASDIKIEVIEKMQETKKEDTLNNVKSEKKEEINKNEVQSVIPKESNIDKKDSFKDQSNINVKIEKKDTKEMGTSEPIKDVKEEKVEISITQKSKNLENSTKNNESKIVENKQNDNLTNIKTTEDKALKSEGDNKDLKNIKAPVSADNKETIIRQDEPTKNKKLASELAQLKTQPGETNINVSKQSLVEDEPESKTKESLLDKLINETKKTIPTDKVQNTSVNNPTAQLNKEPNNDILANIYLSQRNKKVEEKSLEVHNKGKEQALKAKSVEDVKSSAKTLELGLKNANVEVKQNSEIPLSNESTLEKLSSVKNNISEDIQETDLKSKTVSKEASKAVLGETVVNLNVNAQNTNIITQKIIGARQQMSSMMSDIAREMYTNYKPPVTAFRLNLQPAHLGNIAIMIKSDKENSISISMNMSSSATLDAVNENQSSLRSALSKTFGDENSFNLDFGMQDENKNNQEQHGSNSQEQNNQRKKQTTSTEGVLEARNSNKEETLINYM